MFLVDNAFINIFQQVSYSEDGLEAVVFTAQGDMRQALNNLQSTWNGFRHVDSANVFKVCDEPHPLLVKEMLLECVDQNISKAYKVIKILFSFALAFYFIILFFACVIALVTFKNKHKTVFHLKMVCLYKFKKIKNMYNTLI